MCPPPGRLSKNIQVDKLEQQGPMTRKTDANAIANLEKLVTGMPTTEYELKITVVYDDSSTRKRAGEVFETVEANLGARAVRGTWWNLGDLAQPGVLAGAVSQAMRSDMIIISVRGSEGLPLPFYYWVNSWLPHRGMSGTGALVALLGAPVPRNSESGRLRRFLRTVARRARMDLLVAEGMPESHVPTLLLKPALSRQP